MELDAPHEIVPVVINYDDTDDCTTVVFLRDGPAEPSYQIHPGGEAAITLDMSKLVLGRLTGLSLRPALRALKTDRLTGLLDAALYHTLTVSPSWSGLAAASQPDRRSGLAAAYAAFTPAQQLALISIQADNTNTPPALKQAARQYRQLYRA